MSNLYNFMSENEVFNQFMQSQQEAKEAYKGQQEGADVSLGLSLPIAGGLYKSASKLYDTAGKLITTTKKLGTTIEEGGAKVIKSVSTAKETVGQSIEDLQQLAKDTLSKSQELLSKGTTEATSLLESSKTLVDKSGSALGDVASSFSKAGARTASRLAELEKGTVSTVRGAVSDIKSSAVDALETQKGTLLKTVKGLKSGRKAQTLSEEAFARDPEANIVGDVRSGITDTFKGGLASGESAIQSVAKSAEETALKTASTLQKSGQQLIGETMGEGQQIAKSGIQNAVTIGEEGQQLAKGALQTGSKLAGEGIAIGTEAAETGAKIGSNAVNAIKAVGTTVGEVAGETIPVVGELVSLGLTLYDIFHTASGRPQMQAVAHPVYSAGI